MFGEKKKEKKRKDRALEGKIAAHSCKDGQIASKYHSSFKWLC